uniref:Ig-like domain-containing protein n=1 Tax=Papio anubis TaxID=9555 RepID=A0A8I5NXD1_PAPAN
MEVRWFRSQFSPAVFVYKGGRERTEEQMEEYRRRTTFVSKDISRGIVALIIHNVTAQENGTYRCYFQEGRSYDEAILHLMVAESCSVAPSLAQSHLTATSASQVALLRVRGDTVNNCSKTTGINDCPENGDISNLTS